MDRRSEGGADVRLADVMAECARRGEALLRANSSVGEQNTKSALIEPVIAALGWDIYDPSEVDREYKPQSLDKPADYALKADDRPALLIEAKRLGSQLDDRRCISQGLHYGTVAGVAWVALTNGLEWHLYRVHAPVPAEEKRFKVISIGSPRDADLLALLSKSSFAETRLDGLWHREMTERQVFAAARTLICGYAASAEFTDQVTRQCGLAGEKVRSVLSRMKVVIDGDTSTLGADVHPSAGPPSAGGVAASGPSGSASPARRRRSRQGGPPGTSGSAGIMALIRAGLLRAGTRVEASPYGQRVVAEITADGSVLLDGVSHRAVSTAARAARQLVNPELSDKSASTDGWRFWRVQDPAGGGLILLDDLRSKLHPPTPATGENERPIKPVIHT